MTQAAPGGLGRGRHHPGDPIGMWSARFQKKAMPSDKIAKVAKLTDKAVMPRGSKPGERRGGRKAGVPNKTTMAKEAEIAVKHRQAGKKLGVEIMDDAANYFFGLAAKYQTGSPDHDEKKFEHYLTLAANFGKDVAPYQSSRLATITVQKAPMDLSRLSNADLAELERIRRLCTVGGGDPGGADKTRH